MQIRSVFSTGVAIALSFLSTANAQSFYNSGVSSRTVALGGVYTSQGESVLDAMAINPAGLANLERAKLEFGSSVLLARGSFTNAANPNSTLDPIAGVVPFGAFGMKVGQSRYRIAFSATPEMMTAARWQYRDSPGTAGADYGLLDHRSEILAVRSAAGVGIDFGPKFSVGATVGAVYNSNRLKTAYIFQEHPVLAGLKTALDLQTSGVGWNGSVGFLAKPTYGVEFGVAYKSRTKIISRGTSVGNIGVQLDAAGLAARPDWSYDAQVDNVLPQSVAGHLAVDVTTRWRLSAQLDWVNWKRAFAKLPVRLTNGTNADINGLLGSTSLYDAVPRDWKDQFVTRLGAERTIGEAAAFRAGYTFANSPVPNSTLTPLTAAILRQSLSAGYGYTRGSWRLDGAYSFSPSASQTVDQSSLKAGEYNNSRVRVGLQSVSVTTSYVF